MTPTHPGLTVDDLLDLEHCPARELFAGVAHPWEALPRIFPWAERRADGRVLGHVHPTAVLEGPVFIGTGTEVGPHACIVGPAWIGEGCQIRHGAFLRGGVIVGDGAVVGNACELKNCLLFDAAEVPHFAYVGDSILGYKAHLGAGVKISNVKLDKSTVKVRSGRATWDTGLWKFGAILGDHTDVGCNAVLNPGSIVGRGSVIYAGVSFRGVCPAHSIVKLRQTQEILPRT